MDAFGGDVPIWTILAIVATCLYALMMSRDFLTFRKMGIPGPTPLPIIGNLAEISRQGIRAFDINAIQKYGKVFGYFDVLSTNLVISDKEMMKEILVKQFNNFANRRTLGDFLGDLKHSVVNKTGEQWKHGRSVMSNSFSSSKMRKMVPLMEEACDTLVSTCRVKMESGDDGQVEMKRLFGGYTMDVIGSTAFGIHVHSQRNPDDLFVTYAKKMLDFTLVSPALLLIMFCPALRPLLKKMGLSFIPKDSMAYFRKLTTLLLKERRGSKEIDQADFLQLMVNSQEDRYGLDDDDKEYNEPSDRYESLSKEKGLTVKEILGNAQVFFAAGYETTSTALTMIAYSLALNPECQVRLRREIEEKIGSEAINYDNIQKLEYLDMCLTETLRMYPPVLRFDRECLKTTKVKNITIPAGMTVFIPVYAIHHDPEVWGNPEVFNPDRFSTCRKTNYDPLDYIPFGYGPRNCIGIRLALLEAKMATAYIVRNFRLCIGNKTDIPPNLEDLLILKPRALWLKLEDIK